MKGNIKRLFASALTAAVVVSGFPSMAFAADPTGVDWASDYKTFVYGEQSYESEVATVEPTCTEDGYTEYSAVVDGEVKATQKTDVQDALGHDYDAGVVTKEATCVDEGEMTYTCQREDCGDSYTEPIEATGIHVPGEEFTDENSVKEATCTEEGSYDVVTECKFCGKELSRDTVYTEKADHEWVLDEEKSTPATCNAAGENVYACKNCDETKTEVAEAIDHAAAEPVRENVVEATCTERGSYELVTYCKECGEELNREKVETNELGHEYADEDGEITKEATCTEDGEKTFTCTRCGEKITETIPAKGHMIIIPDDADRLATFREEKKDLYTEFVDQKATCEEDEDGNFIGEGSAMYVLNCPDCGEELDKYEDVIPALTEHSWELTETIQEATCAEEGTALYTCSVCGKTEERPVEKLEHTPGEAEQEKIEEATCEEAGSYDEVVYCTECGEEISRETKEVPALGHDLQKDEEASVAPTCTEAGVDVMKCSRCDYTEENEVEAAGHDYVKDEDVSRDATCSREGEFVEVCSVCGDVHKETVAKLDHTPGEAVQENVVDATCTEAGSYDEVVYCTECKEELSREAKEIEALDHDWVKDDEKSVAAACEEDGLDVFKCSRCEETKEEVVPATGHDWNKKVIKEETCEEDGKYYGICKVCGAVDEEIIVPAIGHAYGEKAETAKVYWNEEEPGTGSVEYTYVCANDETHKDVKIEKFDVTDSYAVTTEPKCEEIGTGEYTFTSEELSDGSTVTESFAVEIPALGHKQGKVVKENEIEATCTEGGSYEAVVYCENCGEYEFSRNKVETEALGHDWADAVVENVVNKPGTDDYDDTKPYEYDLVQYCTRCDASEVVKHETIDAAGHNPGEAVKENEVAPTCTEEGSYDLVIYCQDDNEELNRTTVKVPATGHQYEYELNDERSVPVTCTEDGISVYALKCAVCGEWCPEEDEQYDEIVEPVKAEGHKAEFTKEGVVTIEPSYEEPGEKADITYCGICFEEIARGNIETIPALEKIDTSAYDEEHAKAVEDAMAGVNEAVKTGDKEKIAEAKKAVEDTVAAAEEAKAAAEAEAAAKAEAEAAAKKAAEDAAKIDTSAYPEENAKAVADAVKALNDTLADPNATSADINAAKAALEAAVDAAETAKAAAAKKAAEDAAKAAEEKKAADTAAAKKVTDQLNKLTTSSTKDAVSAAEKAYNALTADQKKLVDSNAVKKLDAAKKALAKKNPTLKKFKKSKKVKYSKLKKKKVSFKLKAKANSGGKITYKKLSGNKKIKVSKKGKVTIKKKGLKKGKTYKVKVQVTVAAKGNYKAKTFVKILKIKVR